ncbi:hypothetical protein HDU78_004958 [Chytriomyces hyalinus]|nr:hypothetical protein HDU78_004958 [Chytriomyces hyalinus]
MQSLGALLSLMLFDSSAVVRESDSNVSQNSSSSGKGPFNQDLVFPDDAYAAVLWILFWAAIHSVMLRGVIVPLSYRLIGLPSHLLKSAKISNDQTCSSQTLPATPESSARSRKKSNSQPLNSKALGVASPTNDNDYAAQIKQIEKDRAKLQLAMWKCLSYCITVSMGVYTLAQDTWWSQPELYFKGYPHLTTSTMKIYYNIGFGNYAYQLYTLFHEPRQSDFWAMFTHHICTLVVMGVSYFTSFTRIGTVILLLHDFADPIMEFAKCWLYCKNQRMADVFFGLFAATFLITRNYIFPFHVISACIPYGVYEDGERMPRGYAQYFWICVACLCLLQVLNLNWGYLICKMVYRTVTAGKVGEDIRDADVE